MFNFYWLKNSTHYWINRYEKDGDSGEGSKGECAEFKASVINDFVVKNNIRSVIDFGCGDGNQLRFLNLPNYLGLDVSKDVINYCKLLFPEKEFKLVSEYKNGRKFLGSEKKDLALSLDVIYHLIEDQNYRDYMVDLMNSSEKYVIIYSSNFDLRTAWHVKHRRFTYFISKHYPNWKLIKVVLNPLYKKTDFYIYRKR